MAIGPRLELRHTQSLVMTPQLRQAIKLLQFSNLEVAAFVEEELERNPLLDRDERPEAPSERPAPDQAGRESAAPSPTGFEDAPLPPDTAELARSERIAAADAEPLDTPDAEPFDPGGPGDGAAFTPGRGGSADFADDARDIEEFAPASLSRREHLLAQLRLTFADPADRLIGTQLIALLEPSGRLAVAPAAIAAALSVPLERVERVRAAMLRFDPTGMFACDLRECLAAQLAERNRLDPAMAALLDNLDLLAKRDMRRLMGVCEVDAADLADMVAELRRLDPKPGADFDTAPAQPVMPDILMRAGPDGEWLLELNPQTLPRVLVNRQFSARIAPRASREDRAFLSERLQTANWLVKSLQQRAQTILKVASEIIRQQDGFFRGGVEYLRPLILRDIADAVEMHESTVSRVTSNKFIATPRGTFELKYFFTTAIAGTAGGESHSAEAVRHRIRAMIAAESVDVILSDDAIVAILRREGVDIARRTVAKYREALRIPSSVQRKREKAVPA
jgi:RNA polymerase sigma-54 factor